MKVMHCCSSHASTEVMYGCAVPQPPFQNPHCGGQVINNQTVTLGCIPLTPPLMQDFQDFVNFLAGDTKRPRSFAIATEEEASQSSSLRRCNFLTLSLLRMLGIAALRIWNMCFAEHYSSEQGCFSHYIIWNEVANGDWFDASPLIDSRHAVSDADTNLWLDMCAAMVLHLSLQILHTRKNRRILSLHRLGAHCHIQIHRPCSAALLELHHSDAEDLSG